MLAAGVLGLLIGMIGTDVNSGVARYSLDIPELTDGIGFIAIAMGIFGYGEIIQNLSTFEIFFPEKGGSSREAKRICSECPVRIECLNYALRRDERYGVWGGMSERERRRLKRMAS